MNFRMAIGKSETARAAMVTGRIIDDIGQGRIWIPIHLRDEIAVIDAIPPLVQNDKGHRGTGRKHLSQFAEDDGFGRIKSPIAFVSGGGRVAVAADPIAHRNTAARPLLPLRVLSERCISGAMPDTNAFAIWPEDTFLNGRVIVPIVDGF